MNRKQYNRLSRDEWILVRKRYRELLRAYVPKTEAMYTCCVEYDISEMSFYRNMKKIGNW